MTTRKKRKKPKDNLHAKQLRRVQAVMEALGVLEEYRHLKPVERDLLLRFQSGSPKVLLAKDVENDPDAQHIAREIEDALNLCMVQIAGTDRWMLLKDYFRVAEPLAILFQNPDTHATGRPRLDSLAKAFCAVAHLIDDTYEDAVVMLLDTMLSVLLDHSRIDGRLYWLQPPQDSSLIRDNWKFHLHFEPAQIEREERESVSQLLYRSGEGLAEGFQWLSWTGQQLGLPDADRELPVFVSKHALRQFRERVPSEIVGGHVEQFMFESLQEPVFTDGQRGTKLVEFRLPSGKLGYFVVDVEEHRVILRTFLFLTMNGTPQGDMLYDKLRLVRSDKEHLELDQLSTYMLSDIKQDPDLRQAFEECGCGHLLTMTPEEFVDPGMTNRGGELRKYLGSRLKRLLTDVESQRYRT